MSAATSTSLPEPGHVVGGKYVLERELGRGGMGAVFVARHLRLHHAVAIKVMLADPTNHEASTRFMNEGRAAANIQSDNVVKVVDVDEERGYAFMVLELLEGEDLAKVLDHERKLAPHVAVGYIVQALNGIAQAHAHGIVHRDLKPSNLFLARRPDGTQVIKVLDFGISKNSAAAALAEKPDNLTSTKAMLGSPLYMSPEQLRSSKTVDHRADIWAMGVILYELMCGQLPFMGDSLGELFAMILESEPVPIGARAPEVSPALENIVMKCLSRRPDDRYPSVAALMADLTPHATLGATGRTHASGNMTSPNGPPHMGTVALGQVYRPPMQSQSSPIPAMNAMHDGRTPAPQPQAYPQQAGHAGYAPSASNGGAPMRVTPGTVTGSGANVPVVKGTVPLGATTPQPGDGRWQVTGGAIPKSGPSTAGILIGVFAAFGVVGAVAIGIAWKHNHDKAKTEGTATATATTTEPPPPASTLPPPVASVSASVAPTATTAPSTTATTTVAHTNTGSTGTPPKRPPPKPTDTPEPPKTAAPQKPPPPATATPPADPLGAGHR